MFTPKRRRGTEILDDPSGDPALAARSLRDIALTNRLFGGRRAVLRELRPLLLERRPSAIAAPLTLLDIGTGLGDIPASVSRLALRLDVLLVTIGLECETRLAIGATSRCNHAVAGDAMHLPFEDHAVDIVTVSQVLHHFDGSDADRLLRECARVARDAVVIHELRRSWFAVAGLWIVSFLLGFHPVSRHDGAVSILRGYTVSDLGAQIVRALGTPARVRRAMGWRVTATWRVRREVASHVLASCTLA